jgi:hypothetical protein
VKYAALAVAILFVMASVPDANAIVCARGVYRAGVRVQGERPSFTGRLRVAPGSTAGGSAGEMSGCSGQAGKSFTVP